MATIAAGWWASISVSRCIAIVATFVHPATRRKLAVRRDQPSVSVVIPVAHLEPEMEAAFASVYSQDYPNFEVLITAAERESLAIEVARRVAARFPGIRTRFLLGNERRTLNPKISNTAPAIAMAAHDIILMKDSNVRLSAGLIAELVCNLTRDTGMVCAVPIGVQPEGFAAEVECAISNAHSTPWLLVGSHLGVDIGWGKVMLFDRRVAQQSGGFDVVGSTLGDDHALAKALHGIGLRTVFCASTVRRVMARRTWRDVWNRQLRWMTIRRVESPLAFLSEPFVSAGGATVAAALAAPAIGLPWLPLAAMTLAAWTAADFFLVAIHGWAGSWRFPLAALCREPLLLALWVAAWTNREVTWSGARYAVHEPS